MALKGFWGAGAVNNPPEVSTLTSYGFPTAGDSVKGVPATTPKAAWYCMVDQMRLSVISAAGLTPRASYEQFLEALQSMRWVPAKAIEGTKLADRTVTGDKIADGAVGLSQLADRSVSSAKISLGAVTSDELGGSAVETSKVADRAITNPKLADGAVSLAKVEAASIATVDDVRNGTKKIVTADVLRLTASALPAGSLLPFGGTRVPDGFLLCNGATVSRTVYKTLFEAIGTAFGSGDGYSTFNLPNIHHRFIEMTTSTWEVGQTVEAGLPNISDHYHGFGNNNENNGGNFAAVSSSTSFPKYGNTGVRGWNGSGGGGGFNGTVGNCNMVTTGAKAAAQQVQPASIRVLAIIKI